MGSVEALRPVQQMNVSGRILSRPPLKVHRVYAMMRRRSLVALVVAATALVGAAYLPPPPAHAAPAPQVEYMYDIAVRRHYSFPNNDAIGYGHAICDKIAHSEGYPQVMGDVKSDVSPNDEASANYLVSNAVNLLCPEQIWQLRNSAAGYQPPPS
jgi:hypothetical protein